MYHLQSRECVAEGFIRAPKTQENGISKAVQKSKLLRFRNLGMHVAHKRSGVVVSVIGLQTKGPWIETRPRYLGTRENC